MTQDQEAKLSQVLHVEINRTFVRLVMINQTFAPGESLERRKCLFGCRSGVLIFLRQSQLTTASGKQQKTSVQSRRQQGANVSRCEKLECALQLPFLSHLLALGLVWPSSPQCPAVIRRQNWSWPHSIMRQITCFQDKISFFFPFERVVGQDCTQCPKKKVHRN